MFKWHDWSHMATRGQSSGHSKLTLRPEAGWGVNSRNAALSKPKTPEHSLGGPQRSGSNLSGLISCCLPASWHMLCLMWFHEHTILFHTCQPLDRALPSAYSPLPVYPDHPIFPQPGPTHLLDLLSEVPQIHLSHNYSLLCFLSKSLYMLPSM